MNTFRNVLHGIMLSHTHTTVVNNGKRYERKRNNEAYQTYILFKGKYIAGTIVERSTATRSVDYTNNFSTRIAIFDHRHPQSLIVIVRWSECVAPNQTNGKGCEWFNCYPTANRNELWNRPQQAWVWTLKLTRDGTKIIVWNTLRSARSRLESHLN